MRLSIRVIIDTQAAVEAGATNDPTLFLNGKPFVEGLVAAETLSELFESLLKGTL